jgi:hypothetical protein
LLFCVVLGCMLGWCVRLDHCQCPHPRFAYSSHMIRGPDISAGNPDKTFRILFMCTLSATAGV